VGDDDVVKGRVGAPEARKSDLDNHVSVGNLALRLAGATRFAVVFKCCQFDVWMPVHGPVTGNFGPLQLRSSAPACQK
jgi:hypothetical protein